MSSRRVRDVCSASLDLAGDVVDLGLGGAVDLGEVGDRPLLVPEDPELPHELAARPCLPLGAGDVV